MPAQLYMDEIELINQISDLSVPVLDALIKQLESKTQGIVDYQNQLKDIHQRCMPSYRLNKDLTVGECLKGK